MRREFVILDTVTAAVHSKLVKQAAQVKHRYNKRFVPLFSLPNKVLINILLRDIRGGLGYIPNEISKRTLPKIRHHALAQVCRTWRDVTLESPRLWSTIQFERGEGTLALRLSKALPLRVICRSLYLGLPEDLAVDFFRTLQPQTHRIQSISLSVDGPRLLPAVLEFLHQPTLSLIQLRAALHHPSQQPIAIHLHDGASLQHLELDSAFLHWGQCRLPNLRILSLTHSNGPSEAEMVSMLGEASGLEELSLTDSIPTYANRDGREYGEITLPNLRILALNNISAHVFDRLVASIRVGSALQELILYNVHPNQLEVSGRNANIYKMAVQILGSTSNVCIRCTDTGVYVQGGHSNEEGRLLGERLHLHCPLPLLLPTKPTIDAVINFAQHILPPSGRLELIVESRRTFYAIQQAPVIFDVRYLDSMPNLHRLTLDSTSPGDATRILKYLAPTRRCPDLKFVDLSQAQDVSEALISEFRMARSGDLTIVLPELLWGTQPESATGSMFCGAGSGVGLVGIVEEPEPEN